MNCLSSTPSAISVNRVLRHKNILFYIPHPAHIELSRRVGIEIRKPGSGICWITHNILQNRFLPALTASGNKNRNKREQNGDLYFHILLVFRELPSHRKHSPIAGHSPPPPPHTHYTTPHPLTLPHLPSH